MRTPQQEAAADFFIEQADKVIVGSQNEQGNVLYVLLDQHSTNSEAGDEIARFLIDPQGFIRMGAYTDVKRAEEFNAIYDAYIRHTGLSFPTYLPGTA